jgi:hypothetical protein
MSNGTTIGQIGNNEVTNNSGTVTIAPRAVSTTEIQRTDYAVLARDLRGVSDFVAGAPNKPDAEAQGKMLEEAAEKAEEGDEAGVVAALGKTAKWALELATTVGGAVLTAYLKTRLNLG